MHKQITLLARSEWVLLLASTFPGPLITPFILLFSPYALLTIPQLFYSTVHLLSIFLFMAVLALFFDIFQGFFSVKSKPITRNIEEKIIASISEKVPPTALTALLRGAVVTSDISIGAQVRGIIWPRIIISGGLLVGLLKNDPLAVGVLLHEYAHIRHFDRILPGFIALAMFEAVGQTIKYISHDLSEFRAEGLLFVVSYKLIVFGIIISYISKYREYYADAKAIQILGDNKHYISFLNKAIEGNKKKKFNYFHPSIESRITEAESGYSVLNRTIFWKIYWPLNILISCIQYIYADDDYVRFYAHGVMVISVGCLAFEFLRKPLLSSSDNFILAVSNIFAALRPGKRFARYTFLLSGFIFVIFFANTYGGYDKSTWISVGGAIVYTISRSMK
jgi:Zn-dependent protease with chaperone function